MQVEKIPYEATGHLSRLVLDHLADASAIAELRTHTPDVRGLEEAADARTFDPEARRVLCASLERQYAGMELPKAVRINLEQLRDDRTLTVTTGHQLSLFSGPLYVPFKLLNTIRLAKELTTRLQRPVVPVFWMASEDHDRDEIDHVHVNGQRIEWPGEAGGAVGRLQLNAIEDSIAALEKALGPAKHTEELLTLLRSCYTTTRTLAKATRCLIHGLFGRFGIVILDANDPDLKRLFIPIMENELLHASTEQAVGHANDRIKDNYPVQAHARPINLFHLRPGKRSRIEKTDELYKVLDGGPVFTLDELLSELNRSPESFSPNVLMRPLYQETILPNIAYIGGGGELAYWLQLRWAFQAFQLPMPVLMLRTSAGFLPEKRRSQLKELDLGLPDLFQPLHEVQTRVARSASELDTQLDKERKATDAIYSALATKAARIDPTLYDSVMATAKRAEHGLDRLQKKLDRALRKKEQVRMDRLRLIHECMFPNGTLQERHESILGLFAVHGPELLDILLKELDPLEQQFVVFSGDKVT